VPELSDETDFKLIVNKALEAYKEAKSFGVETRPVVLGPVSYLALAKPSREAKAGFQPTSLLSKLLPVYKQLLSELKQAGAASVQIDEPVLVLDSAAYLEKDFVLAYNELSSVAPEIVLTTYFGRLDSNLTYVAKLPVKALHIDLDRAPGQFKEVVAAVKPTNLILSLGVVSGRNVWKNDFTASLKFGQEAIAELGAERVIIATSSSLLHIPVTLANEKKLKAEQKDWFSFAIEKAAEVATIAASLSGSQQAKVSAALEANKASIAKRREFERTSDDAVRKRVEAITPEMLDRKSPFAVRKETQKKMNLPKFPTTTIGSFPQTKEIRQARAKFTKGEITEGEYEDFLKKEIESVVRFQEKVGLDLLVHGEPERNDMVQYFGELLNGFVFTQNGWVQSYGSR
jgi:5-methyltetrahydropteroyltriglutamate--homocysteine methyltransferase